MLPFSPDEIRILVVDDEEPFRNLLRLSLDHVGYQVETARNGIEALEAFDQEPFDLVLLDVMMPLMNGLETCKELRKRSDVPVVMLTALSRPDDIIDGFAAGADDYIGKPFTFREVEIRLQAILRRIRWNTERTRFQVISERDIILDSEEHRASVRGDEVHLTPIEYQLLSELMSNADRPVQKKVLFQRVWGYDMVGGTNLVEVAIRRLREKIEIDPSSPTYLLTVRGAGYKFSTEIPRQASAVQSEK